MWTLHVSTHDCGKFNYLFYDQSEAIFIYFLKINNFETLKRLGALVLLLEK